MVTRTVRWAILAFVMVAACSTASEDGATPGPGAAQGTADAGAPASVPVPGLTADPIDTALQGAPDAFTERAVARVAARLTSDESAYFDQLAWGELTAESVLSDPLFLAVADAVAEEFAAVGAPGGAPDIGAPQSFASLIALQNTPTASPADRQTVLIALGKGLTKIAVGVGIVAGATTGVALTGTVLAAALVVSTVTVASGIADVSTAAVNAQLTQWAKTVVASFNAQAADCVANPAAMAKQCAAAKKSYDGCRSCTASPTVTDAGAPDAAPVPTSCTAQANGLCAGCSISDCVAPAVAACKPGSYQPGSPGGGGGDGGEGGAPIPASCVQAASCTCLVK